MDGLFVLLATISMSVSTPTIYKLQVTSYELQPTTYDAHCCLLA